MSESEQPVEQQPVETPVGAPVKKKGISLPFLLMVPILAVGAYFGVKQIMYMSMLNDMSQETNKPIEIDPRTPEERGLNIDAVGAAASPKT
ncbi:hypothetical protein [Mariniblastus fucicola]|uniref:Uncharacterized protein n=1 Tax=Mariniblastus fucicola TaxID=980251 RepID=A0A5B9P8W1_9BACT|nr:hypothetical protein [Mariniblastus fucicola]QEG22804.1 hypothetical protein MFFC18_26880 [Mariniblastus fucicola]